jgi:hypothetical protein
MKRSVITIVKTDDTRGWIVTLKKGKSKPEQHIRLGNAGNVAAKAVQLKQFAPDAVIVGHDDAMKQIPESLR